MQSSFKHCFIIYIRLLILAFILGGCGTARETALREHSVLEVARADADRAFADGQTVMRNEFGQVVVDEAKQEVRARPVAVEPAGVALSTRQLRETAILRMLHEGGRSWVCVRIVTERQDSGAWSAFAPGRQNEHYVSPMESGESLDQSRREIWTAIGRDRQREREIIRQIQEGLGETDSTL